MFFSCSKKSVFPPKYKQKTLNQVLKMFLSKETKKKSLRIFLFFSGKLKTVFFTTKYLYVIQLEHLMFSEVIWTSSVWHRTSVFELNIVADLFWRSFELPKGTKYFWNTNPYYIQLKLRSWVSFWRGRPIDFSKHFVLVGYRLLFNQNPKPNRYLS